MKKNKATQKSSLHKSQSDNTRLQPRTRRLIEALLSEPRSIRELVDLIPANNPGDYVMRLRRQYGVTVPCEQVKFTTRDEKRSWYGVYRVTPADQAKLRKLLNQRGAESDA